jgi:integrase
MPYKRPDSKYVQIRVGGVRQSSGTTDEEAAKAIEHKRNLELLLAEQLGIKPPKSFKEMCVRWAREKSGKVTWHDDVRSIAFWDQHFGNLNDIRLINREKVDEIAQKEWTITEGPSAVNNTANHYVSILTSMLNQACRVWDWIERSPVLRRYPISSGRKAWLKPEQWFGLEAVLPVYLARPAVFNLATGLRRAKVFGLEWPQIDMAGRFMSFEGTANKLGNTIPLNDTAMAVLQEIRAGKVVHPVRVFTRDGAPIVKCYEAWYTALEQAGLESTRTAPVTGVCWHTFRHTWNSWLAQRGVSKEIRQRLGGWAEMVSDSTDRYTHLDIESLRPYAAVIDTVLTRSVDEVAASTRTGTA